MSLTNCYLPNSSVFPFFIFYTVYSILLCETFSSILITIKNLLWNMLTIKNVSTFVLPSSLINKVIPTEFRVPVYSSLMEVSSLPRQKLSEIWYLPFSCTFLYFYWICVFLLRMSHVTFLCFNLCVNEIKVCVSVCVCVLFSTCFCAFHLAMFYEICPLFYLLKLLWRCFWSSPWLPLLIFLGWTVLNWLCSQGPVTVSLLFFTAKPVSVHPLPPVTSPQLLYSLEIQACSSKNLLGICNRISCK